MGFFIDWHDPEVAVRTQVHYIFTQSPVEWLEMLQAYGDHIVDKLRPVRAARRRVLRAYESAVSKQATILHRRGYAWPDAFTQAMRDVLP